jgi:hypothetical protein
MATQDISKLVSFIFVTPKPGNEDGTGRWTQSRQEVNALKTVDQGRIHVVAEKVKNSLSLKLKTRIARLRVLGRRQLTDPFGALSVSNKAERISHRLPKTQRH